MVPYSQEQVDKCGHDFLRTGVFWHLSRIVDGRGYRSRAAPFVVYHRKAISVYPVSSLTVKTSIMWRNLPPDGKAAFVKTFLYLKHFAPLASPVNASLLWTASMFCSGLGDVDTLEEKFDQVLKPCGLCAFERRTKD